MEMQSHILIGEQYGPILSLLTVNSKEKERGSAKVSPRKPLIK
jgi:hypothetical protein